MKILVWLLFPFAVLYAVITSIRNMLFDLKIWKSKVYQIPTIGVGNLSMGGTGKSVVIDYLIGLLKKEKHVAVLSRGYKRTTKGFVLADQYATAKTIGDEPYQFYSKNPEISVAVAEKRSYGMEQLLRNMPCPEVFLWDDIFQHRHVRPHLMILTTTFKKPFYKDFIFPVGTLREGRRGMKRAAVILVTKCPEDLNQNQADQIRMFIKPKKHQHLFFTKIVYDTLLKGNNVSLPLSDLAKEPFLLVCGIANPTPLLQFLKNKGFQFETLIFPDHYNFDTKALQKIVSKSHGKKIITTEKDYGRLAPHLKNELLYFLPIVMGFVFPKEQEMFNRLVRQNV